MITKRLFCKTSNIKLNYIKSTLTPINLQIEPKTGDRGHPINLTTNAYFVSLQPKWSLYVHEKLGDSRVSTNLKNFLYDGFQFGFTKGQSLPVDVRGVFSNPRCVSEDSSFVIYFLSYFIKKYLKSCGLIVKVNEFYYPTPIHVDAETKQYMGMTIGIRGGDDCYYLVFSPKLKYLENGTFKSELQSREDNCAEDDVERYLKDCSTTKLGVNEKSKMIEDFYFRYFHGSELFDTWSISVKRPCSVKCRKIKVSSKTLSWGSPIRCAFIYHEDWIEDIISFSSALSDYSLSNFDCNIERVALIDVDEVKISKYLSALRSSSPVDIYLIVIPKYSDNGYCELKWEASVAMGVSTQIVRLRTIHNATYNYSILETLTKQILSKCGRIRTDVIIPQSVTRGLNILEDSMVVGMDTFHHYELSLRSVTAVVSTLGFEGLVHNQIEFVETGQEINNHVFRHILVGLRKWYRLNGRLPGNLIIYRDGISDDMLRTVRNVEVHQALEAVKCAYEEIYSLCNLKLAPKLMFVVVNKRVNNIFFSKERKLCGTVIDSGVTRVGRFDFYLSSCDFENSQSSHMFPYYNVLHNEAMLSPDLCHHISYAFTKTYPTFSMCTIPSVSMLAHKLASMSGKYLMEDFHTDLQHKLFYL